MAARAGVSPATVQRIWGSPWMIVGEVTQRTGRVGV